MRTPPSASIFRVCGWATVAPAVALTLRAQDTGRGTILPNGKLRGTIPGNPRQINNLPTAVAISPDGRFVVFLHSGCGAYTSGEKQSQSYDAYPSRQGPGLNSKVRCCNGADRNQKWLNNPIKMMIGIGIPNR